MPDFTLSEPTTNLEYPRDVFKMQNNVSDNLNKFQIRYSRYLRCQNSNTATEVSDPPCDLNTIDSFSELTSAYKQLYNSLDEVENVLSTPAADSSNIGGVTNIAYNENLQKIKDAHEKVNETRELQDNQLNFIKDQSKNTGKSNPAQLLSTRKMLNMVLIIIALSILYYIIIEI
jgi:hypothetical protein